MGVMFQNVDDSLLSMCTESCVLYISEPCVLLNEKKSSNTLCLLNLVPFCAPASDHRLYIDCSSLCLSVTEK